MFDVHLVYTRKSHLEGMKYHSNYAVFRFTLNTDGHCEMHYKKRSNEGWELKKGHCMLSVSVPYWILF